MKHRLFFLAALLIPASLFAQGVFQLPNAGFEQWDGGNTSEPTHWNTFSSSDGSYASLASSNHHYRRNGGRPGSSGSHYLTIYAKSIIGIVANGNMTTGRIHAGATSATSSNNYNYTQRENADHSQPFTATPDSMYVWVSFYASSRTSVAHIEAIIHGDNDFKAPNNVGNTNLYKGYAVASTTRTTPIANDMEWVQLKVPFVYDGNSEAAYILVNITTNEVPGEGSANDSISVDDIEFIYSAWLTSISVNGEAVPNFSKDCLDYAIHVDSLSDIQAGSVVATTEVDDAEVSYTFEQYNDSTILATITVTAEDGVTTKTYRLFFIDGNADIPIGINETSNETPLVVYPNPAKGTVYVEAEGDVELLDIQGKKLATMNCNGRTGIDIHSYPNGVYLLRHKGVTKKIIISD